MASTLRTHPVRTISSRLIAMALGLIGDPEKVRERIQCTPDEYIQCCAGTRELFNHQFALLIDLIVAPSAGYGGALINWVGKTRIPQLAKFRGLG